MVHFHSTTIIEVVAIIPCNFAAELSTLKSVSPGSNQHRLLRWVHIHTSLCMRDGVTLVDGCKQSTTTSSSHAKEIFQMNTFGGLKAWMDLYRHYVCPGSYLKFAFSFHKAKYDNRIWESPWRLWRYPICAFTRSLCFYDSRLFNDDVSAIGVTYWQRWGFPNYVVEWGIINSNIWGNFCSSKMPTGCDVVFCLELGGQMVLKTHEESYLRWLVPKLTPPQDNSYPGHLLPTTIRIRNSSYQRQPVTYWLANNIHAWFGFGQFFL